MDASTLVPGDLVVLEEGDAIAADLRICESSQLEIIEAILTGESVPASKGTKTIRKRVKIRVEPWVTCVKVFFNLCFSSSLLD